MVPPIFRVALLETVSVPPALVRLAVKPLMSNIPLVTVRSPLMSTAEFKVTMLPALAIVTLLKVVANAPPIIWVVAPLKVAVAVPAAKEVVEELLVQLPLTDTLKLLAFSVPASIERLLLTVIAAGKRRPLVLLSDKLLNVVSPEKVCWPEVPLKLVVPLLMIVPVLVNIPAIFKVPAAAIEG